MTQETFGHLTDQERAVAGSPDDYDWEHPIEPGPAPRRRRYTQFSLRADESLVNALTELATQRGVTFSDLAREALSAYLHSIEVKTSVSAVYSLANASVILHGSVAGAWPLTRASAPDGSVAARANDRAIEPAHTGTS